MSRIAVVVITLLVVVVAVYSAAAVDLPLFDSVLVQLPDKTILRGLKGKDGASVFKGIRFAQPPVGSLRFAPPQPWINNPAGDRVVDATKASSICVQGTADGIYGSEDCLYLNVDVPSDFKDAADRSLPVAIFIHGGSYRTGCGSMYSGTDMIKYWKNTTGAGAIIVTMNYRLSVFGFAGSSKLRSQDISAGSTGVYGLQDQRMAMKWVKENIQAFGGDINKIMIFGESAGAGSVSSHLAMTKSWEYFNAAAMESGSFAEWIVMPMKYSETIFDGLLKEANCADISCLLGKSTEEVFLSSLRVQSPDPMYYSLPFFPTADGVELSTHPWISVAQGHIADVPIMHGTNADEGKSFAPLNQNATLDDLLSFWRASDFNDAQISKLTDLYIVNKTYPGVDRDTTFFYYAGERSYGDYSMSCSSVYGSNELAKQRAAGTRKSPIYLYSFDYLRSHYDFAQHFSEVAFVFHWEYLGFSDSDKAMSDVMTSYWGNFIIGAYDPNSRVVGLADVGQWPQFDTQSLAAMSLDSREDQHATSRFKGEECDFLNQILNKRIRQMF